MSVVWLPLRVEGMHFVFYVGEKVLKCYLVSCVFLVSVIVHADMMWNRSPLSMSYC